MEPTIMGRVKGTDSTSPRGFARGSRMDRAARAAGRRSSSPRSGGRAWINGREVGGRSRLAYLDVSHD